MRAAGPATMRTSTRSTMGRCPGMIATTATGIVPVAPERTRPSESTSPSKRPPCPWKRTRTPSTGLPAASSACAERRNVSPAIITGLAGVTAMRATEGGCAPEGACAAATAGTRKTTGASERSDRIGCLGERDGASIQRDAGQLRPGAARQPVGWP